MKNWKNNFPEQGNFALALIKSVFVGLITLAVCVFVLSLAACNKKTNKPQEDGSINLTVSGTFKNGKRYDGGVFSVYRNGHRHNLQDFTVATGLYNFHKTDSILVDLNPDSFFDYELVINGKRGYKTDSRPTDDYYTLVVKMEQFFK